MDLHTLLTRYRDYMSHWWIVVAFGTIYCISQAIILIVLEELDLESISKLQLMGFTSEYYMQTFSQWNEASKMSFYQTHFIFDSVHWIWYTTLLTALLAIAMNNAQLSYQYNAILALPLIAGLCDALENHIQLIFLADPNYLTIINPLPLISTLASITKWILAAITIITTAVLFSRAGGGQSTASNTITTAISIDADPAKVWQTLTNLEAYSSWNPFIVNASGKAKMNETLTCKPKMPGGGTYTFRPTVTRCKMLSEFAWTGDVIHKSLASGEHIFRIIPQSDHRVRLEHDEEFKGLLAPLFVPLVRKKTTIGFELMNKALKAQVEKTTIGNTKPIQAL